MINYNLPVNITLETPVSADRTVGMAFDAIFNWNTSDIRERLLDGNDTLLPHEVDEAILECRKFFMCIVIAHATKAGSVGMVSKKVDEVWHNAILFTREYFHLSELILGTGRYLHHAPVVKSETPRLPNSNIFPDLYHSLFGRIPSIWGVTYRDGCTVWEDAMQGICLTNELADCELVCVPDAPCEEGGGQLCDESVTCSSDDRRTLMLIHPADCRGVCNPGDCTTPGQLCD